MVHICTHTVSINPQISTGQNRSLIWRPILPCSYLSKLLCNRYLPQAASKLQILFFLFFSWWITVENIQFQCLQWNTFWSKTYLWNHLINFEFGLSIFGIWSWLKSSKKNWKAWIYSFSLFLLTFWALLIFFKVKSVKNSSRSVQLSKTECNCTEILSA